MVLLANPPLHNTPSQRSPHEANHALFSTERELNLVNPHPTISALYLGDALAEIWLHLTRSRGEVLTASMGSALKPACN